MNNIFILIFLLVSNSISLLNRNKIVRKGILNRKMNKNLLEQIDNHRTK